MSNNLCINEEEFLKRGEKIMVMIGDTSFYASTTRFEKGSLGWEESKKLTVHTSDGEFKVMAYVNIVISRRRSPDDATSREQLSGPGSVKYAPAPPFIPDRPGPKVPPGP
jgi:hypothetical protein